ncbi:periodic tryptophan protein 1 homolog [Trichonephila inaurata madagascariensis]|uniref:Periodic tryptophan protein 1 homolog n=1 Tax=Trichonephila inaurata madagascariensis TaxID=2747483 RepID=A0A8X7C2J6_9ARAC|nr:periodic tryptophan protein 1 homolog [Trichonephila inaurata madagascariensis]
MNFIPCVAWVPKGIAKRCPEKLQLTPEELKNLIQETKEINGADDQLEDDSEEETHSNASEDDNNSSSKTKDVSKVDDDDDNNSLSKAKEDSEVDDDDDFEARYNLDTYDDNDDDKPFMNIADVVVHADNKDDEYLIGDDKSGSEEENEDFLIKDNDNLLVVGHVEENTSVMEVYVYNKDDEVLYVHHDIDLPSFPLALEWLDFNPSDDTPGNYVAVGDMSPVISIWDLDIVDILEPVYCLGEKTKKKEKNQKVKSKRHKDAVISLSWNKHVRNILASGSADSSIILWDLQEGTSLKKFKFHTGKVQALQWHPFESYFLLSGCTDGCKSLDMSQERNMLLTAGMDGTLKVWNVENGFVFLKSLKLKVGSIYTAKISPDSGLTTAIGGNDPSHNLKVMDIVEKLKDEKVEKKSKVKNTMPTTSRSPPTKKPRFDRRSGTSSKKSKHNVKNYK